MSCFERKNKRYSCFFTRRQGACLERRNSTVQLTLPGKRACFQWWQRDGGVQFSNTMHVLSGKNRLQGAGRLAGNHICHRKLLYCQIPGKQSAVITVEAIPGTGYRENHYICMYQRKPRSEAFCRLEKIPVFTLPEKEWVSESPSYGFRSSPGGR